MLAMWCDLSRLMDIFNGDSQIQSGQSFLPTFHIVIYLSGHRSLLPHHPSSDHRIVSTISSYKSLRLRIRYATIATKPWFSDPIADTNWWVGRFLLWKLRLFPVNLVLPPWSDDELHIIFLHFCITSLTYFIRIFARWLRNEIINPSLPITAAVL